MKLSTLFAAVGLVIALSACSSVATKEDQAAHQLYTERFHSRADRN